MCWTRHGGEDAHKKELVRSKPLKNIIHTVEEKRYEKASEKVNPRGPLSPFYYSGYCDAADRGKKFVLGTHEIQSLK